MLLYGSASDVGGKELPDRLPVDNMYDAGHVAEKRKWLEHATLRNFGERCIFENMDDMIGDVANRCIHSGPQLFLPASL